MVAAEKVTLPLKKMPLRPKAHANKFIWPEISCYLALAKKSFSLKKTMQFHPRVHTQKII